MEITEEEAFALLCFLIRERNRHSKDIGNINRDIDILSKRFTPKKLEKAEIIALKIPFVSVRDAKEED